MEEYRNHEARWIWYPDDMELYHAMKQNFSRVERGMGWPAYWKSSGFHQRIALWREYRLEEETSFRVYARGTGFVRVIEEAPSDRKDEWKILEVSRALERRETKHAFGERILCRPGKVTVIIHVGRIEALPAALVLGDVICSDEGWLADDYGSAALPAGSSPYFTEPAQDPAVWEYRREDREPVRIEEVPGGTLYEWDTELTASLRIDAPEERLSEMTVYPGESRDEALDTEHCYLHFRPEKGEIPCSALRYVFIPGAPVGVTAEYQYVDFPEKAHFSCDDPRLNRIWEVAEHTFRLCSGIFFTDGIKRDKWIWAGDAYQSFFVNRYLMADADIERRTLVALRGGDPVTSHINTIVDYSLLWILAVYEHLESSGDEKFLHRLWPKMRSLMEFFETRLDENGLITGKDRDWVYIDWADIDKDGPVAGEQMLYAEALRKMAEMTQRLAGDGSGQAGGIPGGSSEAAVGKSASPYPMGQEKSGGKSASPYPMGQEKSGGKSASPYPIQQELSREEYVAVAEGWRKQAAELSRKIHQLYWSEDKGAYIDSYTSGKEHVSRQTNILALRTHLADPEQTERIVKNVLKNEAVPAIRTPYFQFYALDALGELGEYGEVLHMIRDYWGGMLERGAVTFWEEFDPQITGTAQYDMYGDRFGKSLCHAWAASPIYLMARYLVGLKLCRNGEIDFTLTPQLDFFEKLNCTLPVGMNGGSVHLEWDGNQITVEACGTCGILYRKGREVKLSSGQKIHL